MSFRTIGYSDGKPIKVDEGPAYGGSPKLGGSLVVGGPGPNDRARANEISRQHVERTKAAREAARQAEEEAQRGPCGLSGRCRHNACTRTRAREARRLWQQSHLTLDQIGLRLGGRHYSTVKYLLDLAERAA